ncbi:MAG: alpha/beta hydrolase [Alphaproteobacteria bacterium]|nr:alpha/beta hydrolase [Alphaproteobacteria bacterium]
MRYPYHLPALEDRFLPNENWELDSFVNSETSHKIHYSYAPIQNPKGTIICLTGLSEFCEKYIETAKFFNTHHYNFYVMDWAYQGRSCRYRGEPHKRHSDGYESDISDVKYFIDGVIKTNTPLFLLAHSMGSNIALRYLSSQDHAIKAASFSAPMLGIKSLKYFPFLLNPILSIFSDRYVPGGRDWHESARDGDGQGIFSSDLVRDKVHNAWCISNPDLQIGSPTFKWLYESLKSMRLLKSDKILKKICIPVLLAYATKETLVDNNAIVRASKKIENAELLELRNSKHEIMMETDNIRDEFLNKTVTLFNQSV